MQEKVTERNGNKKLAFLFVILSCLAAILTSLTYSAREFLQSGKTLPILELANEYFKAGNMRYQDNDFEGAILAYQDALRLYPGNVTSFVTKLYTNHLSEYSFAWSNLGILLCDMGSSEAGVAALTEAARLMPSRARVHYHLGHAYHLMYFLNEAVSSYKKAIDINPRFTNAYYGLGLVYRDKGEVRRAMEAFQDALKVDPLHTEARLAYCHMLHIKQNTLAAEACVLDTLEINPRMADARVLMGQLLLERRQFQLSLDYFRQALEEVPQHPLARHLVTSLLGRETSYEWRLLFIGDYYDLHAYHYDVSVRGSQGEALHQQAHLAVHQHLSPHRAQREDGARDCQPRVTVSGRGEGGGQDVGECTVTAPIKEVHIDNIDMDNDDNEEGRDGLYVLDLGSGTGLMCEALLRGAGTAHAEVVGVDISPRMNAVAQAKGCYKEIVLMDMNALLVDLLDSEFDVIMAVDVLQHIGDLEETLCHVQSLLRRDGLFVFTIEVLTEGGGRDESTEEGRAGDNTDRVSEDHYDGDGDSHRAAPSGDFPGPSTDSGDINIDNLLMANPSSHRLMASRDGQYHPPTSLGKNYTISPHGIYHHRPAYVEQLAVTCGFSVLAVQDVRLSRFESEGNVAAGVMYVLRARSE